GIVSEHGRTFERYLLMLFALKGLQNGYEYSMASELENAGKFDDVVFHQIRGDGINRQTCTRLLQAKHFTDQSKGITVMDLTVSKSSTLRLAVYFESYVKIRGNFILEPEQLQL